MRLTTIGAFLTLMFGLFKILFGASYTWMIVAAPFAFGIVLNFAAWIFIFVMIWKSVTRELNFNSTDELREAIALVETLSHDENF